MAKLRNKDNIQPQLRPVIVQRVTTYSQIDGNWMQDRRPGILLNPNGRYPSK